LRVAGLIVETEAYLARNDLASHSARGRGRSNASMYLPAGYTYVYPIHAKYCFNVVSGAAGSGSAVLIRALEPTEGISWMQQQRGLLEPRRLTTGPGCLCQSLKIDRRLDGLALFQNAECWIEATEKLNEMSFLMGRSKRIGISKNVDARYRFFVDRNRFVSGRRGDHSGSADRQLMHP
jgi:DNA-3-methyladenine glycosylase